VVLSGINTYSGATQINGGTLSAGAGALSNSDTLAVSGGSLAAIDFKSGANLTLSTESATASFSVAGGTLGAVTNANAAANSLLFSATSGTITLGSLSGAGNTRFGSNAVITNGGISDGVVSVNGSLGVTTVTGGSITVTGLATVGTVTDGTLNLNGATATIGTLSGSSTARVVLGNSNALTVSAGAMNGVISGSGSLLKAGTGTLELAGANSYNGTTTLTGLTPTAGSVQKIENIVISNTLSSAVTVSVGVANNATYGSATVTAYLAYQISVPPNASLVVTDKSTSFYLMENQSVAVIAGVATSGALTAIASFETIT
jgi:autotransporter-associated beta strand protein